MSSILCIGNSVPKGQGGAVYTLAAQCDSQYRRIKLHRQQRESRRWCFLFRILGSERERLQLHVEHCAAAGSGHVHIKLIHSGNQQCCVNMLNNAQQGAGL